MGLSRLLCSDMYYSECVIVGLTQLCLRQLDVVGHLEILAEKHLTALF